LTKKSTIFRVNFFTISTPEIQPACWHCAPYKFTYYYYYYLFLVTMTTLLKIP